jgi:hypothetical protein
MLQEFRSLQIFLVRLVSVRIIWASFQGTRFQSKLHSSVTQETNTWMINS